MKFYGQQSILSELEYIIPEIKAGRNLNILLRADSGCGKTRLAFLIAENVFPDGENIEYSIADQELNLDLSKRIQIVDEIHLLESPEIIYPLMDSGKYTFILCSNEIGDLKEPLVNRCIVFTFEPYSDLEIGAIIYQDFLACGFNLADDLIVEVIKNSNGIPRVARRITERLIIIFRGRKYTPTTAEEIKEIIRNILQLEDGLNPLHRRYLNFINKVKRASLDLIIYSTRIDKQTILKEIEPVLLKKELISITSRGRIINAN